MERSAVCVHPAPMIELIKKTLIIVISLTGALLIAAATAAGSLTYGKTNDDVRLMQVRLQELGYYSGEINGYFGDGTQTAIINFQMANKITPTGLADPQTVERIKSGDAITKYEYINAVRTIETIDVVLSPGDSGKQVKKLNSLLSNLGYLSQNAESEYGAETETAVCLFQMLNGLPVTGIADSDTISLICSVNAINLKEYNQSIVLKYGDSGYAVKRLQMSLMALGYFDGDCSAKFGKNTEDAVYEYQRCNGLEETGECGVEMRIMLAKGSSISYAEAIAEEAVKTLTEGDASEAVQMVKQQLSELGFYTGAIDINFTHDLTEAVYYFQLANEIQTTGNADKPTRLLLNSGACTTMEEFTLYMSQVEAKRGDAGHQVVLLQRRLMDLGYYIGSVNGTYDKATEEAVSTFQIRNGLMETGIADADTRIFMNSDEALTYLESLQLEDRLKQEQMRESLIDSIITEAMNAVTVPYEAGRVGKDLYGNAGLTYALFTLANVELSPTIALQHEAAQAHESWNTDKALIERGDQVFFISQNTLLTGICVRADAIVYASPGAGYVVLVEDFSGKEEYEFVGSVHYF